MAGSQNSQGNGRITDVGHRCRCQPKGFASRIMLHPVMGHAMHVPVNAASGLYCGRIVDIDGFVVVGRDIQPERGRENAARYQMLFLGSPDA